MLLHQIFVTIHCIWALFVWLIWHALDSGLVPYKYCMDIVMDMVKIKTLKHLGVM